MTMLWEKLLDTGFDKATAAVLKGWDSYVASLIDDPLVPGQRSEPQAALQQLRAIQSHDWLELAAGGEDFDCSLYCAAVRTLHRRTVPLGVPVFEAWSALRLLAYLDGEAADALQEQVLDGELCCVLAIASLFSPGRSGWVPFGDATTVLVAHPAESGVVIHRIDPGTSHYAPANSPDVTLPSVHVTGTGQAVGCLGYPELKRLRAELLVAQAAAAAGQAEAMLVELAEYLTAREQFGVPIGSFQALQHRTADLAAELYASHQISRHAAEHLDDHADPLVLGLIAKAFVGSAALRTASEAVQLHGGIGFTWGGGVHFGLKRIMQLVMTGLTVAECEEQLGIWAVESKTLLWAGGLDEAVTFETKENGKR